MTPEQDRLVLSHMHLVPWVLRQMPGAYRCRDFDALTGAGNLGLVLAAARFDPARGCSFFGYAQRIVRGAIVDEMRAAYDGPRSSYEEGRAVEEATDRLRGELGREPTTADIAADLGRTEQQIQRARQRRDAARFAPLDELLDAGLQLTSDTGDPVRIYEEREFAAAVQAALTGLNSNQRVAFYGVYFQHRKMRDLGEELQVTESRISQLVTEAVRKLSTRLEPHTRLERGGRTTAARIAA